MIVDAYCHVGLPRFGSLQNAIAVTRGFGVQRSVLVLGPRVPDFETLFEAIGRYPDRIRGIGIPFGKNERQQVEIAEIQLRAGVAGIRMSGTELLEQSAVAELVGQQGKWIYGVSLINNPAAVEYLLDWLERNQASRVAAPHFLSTTGKIDAPLADLIGHRRFHPILSRHGGNGSTSAYPHTDFTPWIESVVDICGWKRILFGSEYPVIFWRDETYVSCLDWIRHIQPDLSDEERDGFLGETANQVLFTWTNPVREDVHIPDWVSEQFERDRTVPLWDGREVSMETIEQWQAKYVNGLKEKPDSKFSESEG